MTGFLCESEISVAVMPTVNMEPVRTSVIRLGQM
jgi:hypothetical protein